MYIIDFNNTPSESFAHGVLKGLAAPAMLYHCETAPAIHVVGYVHTPAARIGQVLAGDWRRIGFDLANVIEREYGRPTAKVTRKKARGKRR